MGAADVKPVLILGGGLTALGVIRTLGRAAIPTYVLASPTDLARRSRWFRPAPGAASGTGAESSLEALLDASPIEGAVLIPCSDAWATRVVRLRPSLAERFPASLAPAGALETLLDKGRFAEALRSAGVPHPRTAELTGTPDLAAIPDEAFSGSFLKPRDSQLFFQHFGVKAFRVEGRAQAAERLRAANAAGLAVIFQEYIPGPASNHFFVDGFVDRQGSCAATFARRRLRMYPLDFGNSSYMVSVERDDVADAIAIVKRLLDRLGYRGVFSAEFKFDERDRRFKILEVNVRPWWYVEFAARCGVDVCTMAYRDAQKLPVEPAGAYRVGRACVYPSYDFDACRELNRRGQLSRWEWARSWLTAEQPVFRWSDPFPALADVSQVVARRFRRAMTGSSRGR